MTAYHLHRVMTMEAEAITASVPRIQTTYPEAIALLTTRTPIFSGMGKSGIIAQKAASTFRSLGVPAHYVHPGDASHGDLGAVHGDAVMVLLSNSGNTPELSDTILFCREQKVPIIAVTSHGDNPLAEAAQVALCYGKVEEACHMGLAPTCSTAVALALCDALAVDVSEAMGITPADFHKHHPGGKLGKLLGRAVDYMRGPVPQVSDRASAMETALAMTGDVPGVAIVVNSTRVVGVVTDGDMRRAGERKFTQLAGDLCNRDPITVDLNVPLIECVGLMHRKRVTKLLVEDELGAIVGVLNLHDCV